ncbi:hypothetical protein C8R45DRAFT_568709 [Mycena sanguinolenta]|nr:hypothetical protein C8R45DRAFT_568709 [Mycena sanguinolenta]
MLLSLSLANSSPQSSGKSKLDSLSTMKRPATRSFLTGVRKKALTLTPCAEACFEAALLAQCSDGTQLCSCTSAEFHFMWYSCIQGECQADELTSAQAWLASGCAGFPVTDKPTVTIPFLPSNSNADIGQQPAPTSSLVSTNPTPERTSSSGRASTEPSPLPQTASSSVIPPQSVHR